MASSRWKRFAFFERHTLSLPNEVLEDLIPVGNASHSTRRSLRTLQIAGDLAIQDSVSLAVTAAGLPLHSKPVIKDPTDNQDDVSEDALKAMWTSLTACTSVEVEGAENPPIQLASQRQLSRKVERLPSAVQDGLVLAFVSSKDTELVHCFDVTVRCRPGVGELEDMDGWRGYFAPFAVQGRRTTEEAVVQEHMEDENKAERIVALASCREDTEPHRPVMLACAAQTKVVVWEDPHLYLSCRRPLTSPKAESDAKVYTLQSAWSHGDGECSAVDIVPGFVAVGTTTGTVIVYVTVAGRRILRTYLRIAPPLTSDTEAVSVKLSVSKDKASVFVAYRRTSATSSGSGHVSSAGVCCYDMPLPGPAPTILSAPSARHDLDGRYVGSSSLVDAFHSPKTGLQITAARPDGLYSYSQSERIGVAPIDGTKLAMCVIPPPAPVEKVREVDIDLVGSGYALVASTDAKSGRDAVDIYDSTNKLVAFHLLLSPGHRAVRVAGVTTSPVTCTDGSVQPGRSSALVLTSGGSLVTLAEKSTEEKISLLVQKNLYSAAIMVAYADPTYEAAQITALYREYAEHLYRKGDFSGAMEQYIYTIGSLESSHVIFRFLDAPKIPLLVKYLEKLRSRELATSVHNELLRTCYLKLNDTEAADAIAASSSRAASKSSFSSILTNLTTSPKEALATICSLDARQAAEILMTHGATLARAMPRETAGVIVSLCVGSYSPKGLASAAVVATTDLDKMIELSTDQQSRTCDPYPVHLFASAFLENPKMLRLILSHCNRHKCHLTPSLRRTLLELTLAEWNQAKRNGDVETEKLRHKEAIAALTDSHCRDIGDYDALVIVQLAGFDDGELLLYERLQMTPMLLERYAKDGSEKSRRQMLAMCQTDPEILADVLSIFVKLASEKLNNRNDKKDDYDSDGEEIEEILEDIQEALALARRQGVLPPVRIARILAGEGPGQFSSDDSSKSREKKHTVPLSVALEYVGTILEESRQEIWRLTADVEEYNELCNSMESEIDSLLRASNALPPRSSASGSYEAKLNIDETYAKVRSDTSEAKETVSDQTREAFWRDMNQSEDSFDVIARFFAKGVIN